MGVWSAWLSVIALSLAIATSASAQTMYKCVGADGKVSYQQTPCAGAGKKIEVDPAQSSGVQLNSSPAVSSGTDGESVTVPSRTTPSAIPPRPQAAPLPASLPPRAAGRLDGWPKSGHGLVEGMGFRDVIQQVGASASSRCRRSRRRVLRLLRPQTRVFHERAARVVVRTIRGKQGPGHSCTAMENRGSERRSYGDISGIKKPTCTQARTGETFRRGRGVNGS